MKQYVKDFLKTITILVISFVACLFVQDIFEMEHLIPAILLLRARMKTAALQSHGMTTEMCWQRKAQSAASLFCPFLRHTKKQTTRNILMRQ